MGHQKMAKLIMTRDNKQSLYIILHFHIYFTDLNTTHYITYNSILIFAFYLFLIVFHLFYLFQLPISIAVRILFSYYRPYYVIVDCIFWHFYTVFLFCIFFSFIVFLFIYLFIYIYVWMILAPDCRCNWIFPVGDNHNKALLNLSFSAWLHVYP